MQDIQTLGAAYDLFERGIRVSTNLFRWVTSKYFGLYREILQSKMTLGWLAKRSLTGS